MAEPRSLGATQVTMTSSGLQVVTGAAGWSGACAVRIVTTLEKNEYPYELRASTLN